MLKKYSNLITTVCSCVSLAPILLAWYALSSTIDAALSLCVFEFTASLRQAFSFRQKDGKYDHYTNNPEWHSHTLLKGTRYQRLHPPALPSTSSRVALFLDQGKTPNPTSPSKSSFTGCFWIRATSCSPCVWTAGPSSTRAQLQSMRKTIIPTCTPMLEEAVLTSATNSSRYPPLCSIKTKKGTTA